MPNSSNESNGWTESQTSDENSLGLLQTTKVKRAERSGIRWSKLSIISACGSIAAKTFHEKLALIMAMEVTKGDAESHFSMFMIHKTASFMLWTATILTIVAILAAVFACHSDKSPIRRTTAVVLSAASLIYWFVLV